MKPKIDPDILGNPKEDLALSQSFEVQVFHRRRRSDNGITTEIEINVVSKGGVPYPRPIRVMFDPVRSPTPGPLCSSRFVQ